MYTDSLTIWSVPGLLRTKAFTAVYHGDETTAPTHTVSTHIIFHQRPNAAGSSGGCGVGSLFCFLSICRKSCHIMEGSHYCLLSCEKRLAEAKLSANCGCGVKF